MILSHKFKFIFFCNGKTGTTSIEQSLGHLHEGQRNTFSAKGLFIDKHIPPTLLRACVPEYVWRDYFKFVFVRNPFDRCVSLWNYNFNFKFRTLPDSHPAKQAVTGSGGGVASPRIMGRSLRELAATRVFSADDVRFLFEFLKRTFLVVPYASGSYQTSFVLDPEGNQLVDYVGRFERLDEDYGSITQKLGLQLPPLPRLNRTASREYRTYYTEESAGMVAKLWAADFETFGYAPVLDH